MTGDLYVSYVSKDLVEYECSFPTSLCERICPMKA